MDNERSGFIHDHPVIGLIDHTEARHHLQTHLEKSFTQVCSKKHAGSPYENELPALIKSHNPSGLGLVAETLFMAILLHALLALVLVDLCFAAFLNGAHGIIRGWGSVKSFRGRAC